MRIGELATASGTTAKTIRFYEGQGLIPEPARTPGGYRDYGPDQITRLRFIRRMQAAGLSLTEVRQVLAIIDRDQAPCGHVEQLLRSRLAQVRTKISDLVMLESHLAALLAAVGGEHSANGPGETSIRDILPGRPRA
ncbi:heavy metal-responsive transcriptional regulator [Nocardia salmonicida]|uniref:heavy metal-responsive transcriptional regulator n=1 Tax=Nocardia salmonicida TaxID=53431 RepID=UPI0007A42C18|nr:heavy metal-responsive transcriptional regulator [Nocardia salmonicida]